MYEGGRTPEIFSIGVEYIWQNPLIEKPLPWIMWATSFFIGIIIVGMRWKGRFQEIMYPSIAFLRVAILITLLYWSAHLHSLILS